MSDTVAVAIGFCLVGLNITLGLALVFFVLQFWKHRETLIFIKRRGNLVVTYAVCCIVLLCIAEPTYFFSFWPWPYSPPVHTMGYFVLSLCHRVLWFASFECLTLFVLCRYWLIHFDIKYTHCQLNAQWKQCIASNLAHSWYIEKRASLGDVRYMTKITVVVVALMTLVLLPYGVLNILGRSSLLVVSVIQILQLSVSLFLYAIIWRRTPFFNDAIHLYDEFRVFTYFWFISTALYALTVVLSVFLIKEFYISQGLIRLNATLTIFGTGILSTFWVLRHIRRNEKLAKTRIVPLKPRLSLREVLHDYDMVVLFMHHLCREFSTESLLAIIEFYQFRVYAQQQLNIKPQELERSALNLGAFPANLPRSDIVYQSEDDSEATLQSLRIKALALHAKYIGYNSKFQINISHHTRRTLEHALASGDSTSMNPHNMATLFDASMIQLMSLLNHSLTRFTYSKL